MPIIDVRSVLTIVFAALTLDSASTASDEAQPVEIEAAVVVGATVVPLSVKQRFSEVAGALPEPGRLQVEDSHDRAHDAHTYCYAFETSSGNARLEFFDSEFGLHTAQLSRGVDSEHATCTPLPTEPHFLVGTSRYSLGSNPIEGPPGFRSTEKKGMVSFKREWTYSDAERPQRSGTCFSRSVSITVVSEDKGVRSIIVQNWEEPGC